MSNERRTDLELQMSTDQVLDNTADIPSTNQMDLGGNMGEGDRLDCELFVTANDGGITIKVAHSDDDITTLAALGASTSEFVSQQFTIADGETGKFPFTYSRNMKKKTKLFYTAGTSGTISAGLTTNAP